MSTQLSPDRMSLPPPHASDLTHAGRTVGWVRDDAIGLRGFDDAEEAMSAAWIAHRTLARHLARRDGTRLVPLGIEPLALARTGDRESILAVGRPIATLLRPGDDSRGGPDSFGFEVPVPPHGAEHVRAMAFLIYRTLRRSGVRWGMWRTDGRGPDRPERSPRREPRAGPSSPTAAPRAEPSRHEASLGETLLRIAVVALIIVLVAVVAIPLAAAQPATIPVAAVVVAALGAAAVGEANRRWQPRRWAAARRATPPPASRRPERRDGRDARLAKLST